MITCQPMVYISLKKDRYFPIGDIERRKFGFLNNNKQINILRNENKTPEKHLFIGSQITEAEFNKELLEKVKQSLIDRLFKYKIASEIERKPLGAIIGNEVEIFLNVENPCPHLLKRPAYPASPRAREALEVHIKESIDIGVLKKVGNNEQVEVTTHVLITWHNGKERMAGDFRAPNIYTIPGRYPIPRIHEISTQFSQVNFIAAMDSLNGFHQNVLTDNSRKPPKKIAHCGIYEYLRIPLSIKNALYHYQIIIQRISNHLHLLYHSFLRNV
ncbi:hypothetical protein O181_084005 [Austropuccinia psidii MF-1]|uniref:Reverse transcriptase domain-containing protein n=1 Tax=Austropuccinia psidii MF-1 TaxID=1389203 RepID=A0A9Q3FPB0_9BASI|nr:hypothetical protein [Austropuccinia psidii MF-1]